MKNKSKKTERLQDTLALLSLRILCGTAAVLLMLTGAPAVAVAQVSFTSPVNLPLNRPTNHVAVGDFNGDAIPDIAAGFNISDQPFVSPFAASRFAIFLGTGGGSFGSPTIFDPGTGCGGGRLLK